MTFRDHFSDASRAYATFRPSYPAELIRWLASLTPSTRRAWDCATGNGQAAILLAEHFADVIATDASEAQIAAATPHARVRYAVATERESGLEASSMDLVTVAQALHWFDIPAFFREADRVLVPRGILAIWSYGKPSLESSANRVLHWMHDERIGPFWPSERMNVESGYRTVALPYPEIPAAPRTLAVNMTRDALVGYVGTWSAVRQARLKEGTDPVPEFVAALAEVWPDEREARTVSWPLTVRVGRRPG
ncbi:MAG TPA: class I SAM-dependent methyltransferase [Gemmatimonadaceae bacterium]|nr:class I SAM-dependent methyltransferase [Gemmatimonadaceae bacterium]